MMLSLRQWWDDIRLIRIKEGILAVGYSLPPASESRIGYGVLQELVP